MSERGTRFQASVVTFGPLGRLLITAAVIGVAVWMLLFANIAYAIALIVWVVIVMPKVLRDVWRRAELPETDLTQLRDQAARDAAVDPEQRTHRAFEGELPTRW